MKLNILHRSNTGLILTTFNQQFDCIYMMRNKILLTTFLLCLFSASFAQPKKLIADKIIATVGDKIILKSDIDNSLQDMQRQGVEIPADARCLTLQQSM